MPHDRRHLMITGPSWLATSLSGTVLPAACQAAPGHAPDPASRRARRDRSPASTRKPPQRPRITALPGISGPGQPTVRLPSTAVQELSPDGPDQRPPAPLRRFRPVMAQGAPRIGDPPWRRHGQRRTIRHRRRPARRCDDERGGNRNLVGRLAALAPPMVKTIMLLILDGPSFAEIGERLGISARVVEGRLHCFRTQVKSDARRGRLDFPLILAAPDAA
jgi:hypothetical protein